MTRPHPVRAVDWTEAFKASYKKLSPEIQEKAKQAIKDLLKNPVPKHLRFEKLSGQRNPSVYTIHATRNHSHKISFELKGDTAILRNVGTHKKIDSNP